MASDAVPATASGFSREHAEALGARFVVLGPDYVQAQIPGSPMAFGGQGDTIEKVLQQIEDWHVWRLRVGAAVPGPVSTGSTTEIVKPPAQRRSGKVAA